MTEEFAFIIGMMGFVFILFVLAVLAFVFWILMLIDAVKRTYNDDNEKVVWVIVLVLTGIIGAVIYYFVVKVHDRKSRRRA